MQNISRTLQGSGSEAGMISRLQGERAEQVTGREPFVVDLRAARNDAARLEFIEKQAGQPDKKRGVL
ncbi:hypothetical protein EBR78_11755, partial [bacterium]|nr:hypothetical protein [bacterium]